MEIAEYKELMTVTKMLREKKIPYTLERVNTSFSIKSKAYQDSFQRRSIPPIELGFIKRIKNYVKKNNIDLNFEPVFTRDVRYVNYNLDNLGKGMYSENIIEIDLDQAYWEMAYQLGVISDEIYEYGSKENGKISKKGRLIALGSLAKKKTIIHFDGENTKIEHEQEASMRNVFLNICKAVGDVINSLREKLGSNYYFHWVDAVFIENTPSAIKIVEETFRSHGFHFKTLPLNYVKVENKTIYAEETKTGKKKQYKLPTHKELVSYYDLYRVSNLLEEMKI